MPSPFRLRAHSTRSVVSSWALTRGASLTDICRAASWKTPNTFARFYSQFPPVFSPQTGRSTEGLRFQVGLLKTAPESPYCRPCRAPPSPRQPNVEEHLAPGPHSMNPCEPVEGCSCLYDCTIQHSFLSMKWMKGLFNYDCDSST